MKRFLILALAALAGACDGQVAMKQYKSLLGADYVCVTNSGPYLVSTRAVADAGKAVADAAAAGDNGAVTVDPWDQLSTQPRLPATVVAFFRGVT